MAAVLRACVSHMEGRDHNIPGDSELASTWLISALDMMERCEESRHAASKEKVLYYGRQARIKRNGWREVKRKWRK